MAGRDEAFRDRSRGRRQAVQATQLAAIAQIAATAPTASNRRRTRPDAWGLSGWLATPMRTSSLAATWREPFGSGSIAAPCKRILVHKTSKAGPWLGHLGAGGRSSVTLRDRP